MASTTGTDIRSITDAADAHHEQAVPPSIGGRTAPTAGPEPRARLSHRCRPAHRRMGRRLGFRDYVDEAERHEFLREERERLKFITDQLDDNGFDVGVFLVAASGFLTDSYLLFVTNTVIPSIIYVYMHDKPDEAGTFEMWINLVTLIGSIVGQVLFGLLADLLGRTSLYGWELIIVILSTLGFAFTSQGILPTSATALLPPSLDLKTSFYFWRFVQGVGIGAEYPLSAVLTAEWASVDYRAQMLAAVFAMQPLGQLCAAIAGLSAIAIVDTKYGLAERIRGSGGGYDDYSRVVVDRVWRGIVLFGAIPSVLALIFRFYLTDPGRYTLEVQGDIDQAEEDTERQISRKIAWPWKRFWPWTNKLATASEAGPEAGEETGQGTGPENIELQQRQQRHQGTEQTTDTASSDPAQPIDHKQSFGDLWAYIWTERNITLLFGTCGTWFLLDVAFYGLGISSPHTLAVVWANQLAPSSGNVVEPWNPDPTHPDDTIVDVLRSNSRELILTSALGALGGSIALIAVINRVRRKWLLQWSFLVLSGFLLATALSMRYFFGTGRWKVTFAFYVICQFLFNFGPNTLTFLIPAEIFPTRYRCFFHGLSAASGKLGSVVIRIALHFVIQRDNVPYDFNHRARKLFWVMISFMFAMAGGSAVTKIFIPDVQESRGRGKDKRLVSETLEALAPGLSAPGIERQSLGARWFKDHWPAWLKPSGRRDNGDTVFPSASSLDQSHRPPNSDEVENTSDFQSRAQNRAEHTHQYQYSEQESASRTSI